MAKKDKDWVEASNFWRISKYETIKTKWGYSQETKSRHSYAAFNLFKRMKSKKITTK